MSIFPSTFIKQLYRMEWKWTHGGPYLRSKRQYNSNNTNNDNINQDIIIEGYGNIYLEPFICNLIYGLMRATYFNNINIICSNSVTGFNLSVNSVYLYVNNCNFTGAPLLTYYIFQIHIII